MFDQSEPEEQRSFKAKAINEIRRKIRYLNWHGLFGRSDEPDERKVNVNIANRVYSTWAIVFLYGCVLIWIADALSILIRLSVSLIFGVCVVALVIVKAGLTGGVKWAMNTVLHESDLMKKGVQ